jgi:small subunit ribosomal protein S7
MRRPVRKPKPVQPDFTYASVKVSQLINYTMEGGKKNAARKIVYGAFDMIKEKTSENPLDVFELALKNAGPVMEVRSRRIGGANYQVPREVRPERRNALALRWIIGATRAKKGSPMHVRLADELMAAAKNEGEAVRKRENTHKMAESNRAFAHFAW